MKIKFLLVPLLILYVFAFVNAFSGDGDGSTGVPYEITNCTQLQEMNNDLSSNYILVMDINCSDTINWNDGKGFNPIGDYASTGNYPFTGTLDGQNYKITDLYVNDNSRTSLGLFGYSLYGTISNVNLENVNITGNNYTAGLVGLNSGYIYNSSVTGNISGQNNVGGLSTFSNVEILDSTFYGNIFGHDFVGGLVSEQGGVLANSNASGNVTGYIVGGITAIGSLINENSFFTGNINLIYNTISTCNELQQLQDINFDKLYYSYELINDINCSDTINWNNGSGFLPIEGFSGILDGQGYKITDLYINGGNGLFANVDTANIFNLNLENVNITSNEDYSGALIGVSSYSIVENCSSSGSVWGMDYVGGLIGLNSHGNIANSYSTANVNGNSYVGGLIGYVDANGFVENSYSAGSVSGVTNAGGFDGGSEGTVTNSFWDINSSGQIASPDGIGKYTYDMKNISTFKDADWDIGVTGTDMNNGYPHLSMDGTRWLIFQDMVSPTFTIIPQDASIFYGNESLLVQFIGTDETAFDSYSLNDTRFSINQEGFLSNETPMNAGNYAINVTINDTSGNINWITYKIQVKKSNYYDCGTYFSADSPIVYPEDFIAYTNCSSDYTLYLDGVLIENATLINSGARDYNITVQRTDTDNYTNTVMSKFFTVNKNPENFNVLFNVSSGIINYPDTFLAWANSTTSFVLSRNGTTIANNSEQISLAVGTYNFSVLRDDASNYTFYYNETNIRIVDGTFPMFTTIPTDASIFYGNESLLVQFVGTDETAFDSYSVNDTSNFSINSSGFLSNITSLGIGNYNINITINDTSNNINWTIYNVNVKAIPVIPSNPVTPAKGGGGGGGGGSSKNIVIGANNTNQSNQVTQTSPVVQSIVPNDNNSANPSKLFDIKLELDSTAIKNSSELSSVITFTSFGSVPTPVDLTYAILNSSGKEVYSEQGYVSVTTEQVVRKSFNNLILPSGKYTLVLTTVYNDNVRDEFRQAFEVANKSSGYGIYLLIGIICVLLIGTLIMLYSRHRIKVRYKNEK